MERVMDWLYHFRKPKKTDLIDEIVTIEARRKVADIIKSKAAYTPDLADLSNKMFVSIFIYNDLMQRRDHHCLLEPKAFCGEAYTTTEFQGWHRNKDRLPIIMPPRGWGNMNPTIVKGEVFLIPVKRVQDLDLYHNNGVEFIRQKIEVEIPFEEDILNKDKLVVKSGLYHNRRKVWAYVGNPSYWWDNRINKDDFTQMPIITPNKTWKSLYIYHATIIKPSNK